MKQKLKWAFEFFWVCLIMGATCFGGGYGMIPIIEKEFCTKRKYLTQDELTEVVTMAQTLPGLISINSLIIISYRKAGFLGVMASILGLVLPALAIIITIAFIYDLIKDNKWVNACLTGIKGSVIGILVYATLRLWKSSIKNAFHLIIMLTALGLALFVPINPIYIILSVGGVFILALYTWEIIDRRKIKQTLQNTQNTQDNQGKQDIHTQNLSDEEKIKIIEQASIENNGQDKENENELS